MILLGVLTGIFLIYCALVLLPAFINHFTTSEVTVDGKKFRYKYVLCSLYIHKGDFPYNEIAFVGYPSKDVKRMIRIHVV